MNLKNILCCFIIVCAFSASAQVVLDERKFPYSEPSEIQFDDATGTYFMLAQKCELYRVDTLFQHYTKIAIPGTDTEGLCLTPNYVILAEETFQKLIVLDRKSLTFLFEVPVAHFGGRNEGIESIVYLPDSKHYLLATEKDPCVFIELNEEFKEVKRYAIPGISEVSSMTYFNRAVWVLSDEGHALFQLDSAYSKIQTSYPVNIINPEGIVFTTNKSCWICSDDMAKLFKLQWK